jgi:hypothetical protein
MKQQRLATLIKWISPGGGLYEQVRSQCNGADERDEVIKRFNEIREILIQQRKQ